MAEVEYTWNRSWIPKYINEFQFMTIWAQQVESSRKVGNGGLKWGFLKGNTVAKVIVATQSLVGFIGGYS